MDLNPTEYQRTVLMNKSKNIKQKTNIKHSSTNISELTRELLVLLSPEGAPPNINWGGADNFETS